MVQYTFCENIKFHVFFITKSAFIPYLEIV